MRKLNGLRLLIVATIALALGLAIGLQVVSAVGAWTSMASAPEKVKWGGALAYDGTNYIYAFRGDEEKDFWRYSISGNTWETLTDAPDKVKEGGALAYANGYVYALQGKDQKSFWRYSYNGSGGSWEILTEAPDNVKAGGALAYSHVSGYIYAFRGDEEKDFWRYSISGNTWETLTGAPDKVKEGGALAYANGYVYALQGKDQKSFWRYSYNGSGGTWEILTEAPDKVKAGGALAYDGSDYVYAFRGDEEKDFWRYSISGNTWETLTDAPDKVKEGGALVRAGDYIYALQGKDQKAFWRYSATDEPGPSCGECAGKVTQLTLRYKGTVAASVEVIQKNGETRFGPQMVSPDETFTFTGTDNGTLGTEITIKVNGVENTKIHTSCSQDIGPGLVKGDFEVVEGYSKDGGELCPVPDCGDCDGKVTRLTLRYNGTMVGAFIEVIQKNADVVFSDTVQPGHVFDFTGTDNGTLGTEITIKVNGLENTTIHTSCSQDIGPGMVFGDFEVLSGHSKDGGRFCGVLGIIGDYVWWDNVNNNAQQDSGEPGISGVIVDLYNKDDGSKISAITTDTFGFYIFTGLDAGNYVVKLANSNFQPGGVLLGWGLVAKDAPGVPDDLDSDFDIGRIASVTLGAGEQNLTIDAGLVAVGPAGNGSIGDLVWNDQDGQGDQGNILFPWLVEPGINGVVLDLYDDVICNGVINAGDSLLDTATTANDATGNPGYYLFQNLDPGCYIVKLADSNFQSGGALFLYQKIADQDKAGVPDDKDSDFDPTSKTAAVAFPGGQDLTIDAGVESTAPPTAVTLSSFAANSSAGGSASPLWLGLAGLAMLAVSSLLWVKRRS